VERVAVSAVIKIDQYPLTFDSYLNIFKVHYPFHGESSDGQMCLVISIIRADSSRFGSD
jgi:hypothetical protein